MLLKQMEPENGELLRLCAIPHQFDINVLQTLLPDSDKAQAQILYEEFSNLSIIICSQSELTLHDEARLYLFNQWLKPENAAKFTAVSEKLVEYYNKRADDVSGVALEIIRRNQIFHLLGLNQAKGFIEFELFFNHMRYQFRLSECKTLIGLVHEYDSVLESKHAKWLTYHEGKLAIDLRQWSRAEQLFNEILENGELQPELRTKVYNRLGSINEKQRNWDKAMDFYQKALQLARTLANPSNLIYRILHNLGVVYRDSNDLKKAEEFLNESNELADGNNDLPELARGYNSVGTLYHKLGNTQQAIEAYEKCLECLKQNQEKFRTAQVYNNLGMVYTDMCDWQKSEHYFQESLVIKRQAGDTLGQAMTLNNLARIYRNLNNPKRAIEVSHQAINLFGQMKDYYKMALAKSNLGKLYRSLKDIELSKQSFTDAIEFFKRCGELQEVETIRKELNLIIQKKSLPWWAWTAVILVSVIVIVFIVILILAIAG